MHNHCGLSFLSFNKAAASDPDIITFDQAMVSEEEREAWKEAMRIEIKALEDHRTWDQVPITDARTKILPLIWVLHHKHLPDGEIKKLKAHICVQGDLEEGVFDTFAPVVFWILV